jgi:LamB/YcsF family
MAKEMEEGMPLAINCDMGESFGLYHMGDDQGMMSHITVANVARGFHASDPVVMHKTVRLAKHFGVRVGAPDDGTPPRGARARCRCGGGPLSHALARDLARGQSAR